MAELVDMRRRDAVYRHRQFIGVLGEYLWRSLDKSRGRPRYIIEGAPMSKDSARRSFLAGSLQP